MNNLAHKELYHNGIRAIVLQTSLTQWELNKITNILQVHFLARKFPYFDPNLTEVCFSAFKWQQVSTGAGNGMAPDRRQAITWTNDDPVR